MSLSHSLCLFCVIFFVWFLPPSLKLIFKIVLVHKSTPSLLLSLSHAIFYTEIHFSRQRETTQICRFFIWKFPFPLLSQDSDVCTVLFFHFQIFFLISRMAMKMWKICMDIVTLFSLSLYLSLIELRLTSYIPNDTLTICIWVYVLIFCMYFYENTKFLKKDFSLKQSNTSSTKKHATLATATTRWNILRSLCYLLTPEEISLQIFYTTTHIDTHTPLQPHICCYFSIFLTINNTFLLYPLYRLQVKYII